MFLQKKIYIRSVFHCVILLSIIINACTENKIYEDNNQNNTNDRVGFTLGTVVPDINIVQRGTKISQLTGDFDKHLGTPTLSLTKSKYRVNGTDLGVPFNDGDTTWILFGDTWGPVGGERDAIGYTTSLNPDEGLVIDFVSENGIYKPLNIPTIQQGAFEVPSEGIVVGNEFFVWHTTDHTVSRTMGRNILAYAIREDAVRGSYTYLYDFSITKFINVSAVKINNKEWDSLPDSIGESLIIFGSGEYRASQIYLAYLPIKEIKSKRSIRYFAGVLDNKPLWSQNEADAQPIFIQKDPGVGELSASYNQYIEKWILLYNHLNPRGINLRTADYPWGPWSDHQIVFHPWDDEGYCNFIHTKWQFSVCDSVHDNGRENIWGGNYGPYQFEHFAKGGSSSTTIYFTMSTWNPYDVVLMKAHLQRK